MKKLFKTTREARLAAIARAKKDELIRAHQIQKLEGIRKAIAIRDAKESARYQALQEAEKAFKIRERDILEKQLRYSLAANKKLQAQFNEFVKTTDLIIAKLNDPAKLFKTSEIANVKEFDDYYVMTYSDGREVTIPVKAVGFILKNFIKDMADKIVDANRRIDAINAGVVENTKHLYDVNETSKRAIHNVKNVDAKTTKMLAEQNAFLHNEVGNLKKELKVVLEKSKDHEVLIDKLTKLIDEYIK